MDPPHSSIVQVVQVDGVTGERGRYWIVAILVVAGTTRLVGLESTPPGLHHDEASNGYDAYSLLKTGQDRWGNAWPILLEAFGERDHRAALYAYLIIPFQFLLGPERLALATRLPASAFGVCVIAATYWVMSRALGRAAGIWAALLLTFSPWHLQISRFGHESALSAGYLVWPLACLIWARFPLVQARDDPSEWWASVRAAPLGLATVAMAMGLYTYPSVRLFGPAMLVAFVVIYRRSLHELWTRRAGVVLGSLLAGLLVAAPMMVLHVTHWSEVTGRARQTSLFHQLPLGEAVLRFVEQYAAHFAPGWLLLEGDAYAVQSPPGFGQLAFLTVPLMILGFVRAIRRRHENRMGWLLIAWLLLYPVAAAATDAGPHALRSACGIPVFQMLAAIGLVSLTHGSGGFGRRREVGAACALIACASGAFVLNDYFNRWARDPWTAALYQRDLCRAMEAVRPIAGRYDRIYISDQQNAQRRWYSGESYVYPLLFLPVAPDEFHDWDKSVQDESSGFHRVSSFGPFVMSTRADVLAAAFRDRPDQRALIVARPGEIVNPEVLMRIATDDGETAFEIISVGLR